MIELVSEDSRSRVIVELLEVVRDPRLRIEARLGEFSGRLNTWIEQTELLTFVRSLATLEDSRKGSATLKSMSPGEFSLSVGSIDSSGHLLLEVVLKSLQPGGQGTITNCVSGAFLLDPTRMPLVLKQSIAMHSAAARR